MATVQYPVLVTRTYYGYGGIDTDYNYPTYSDNWYNSTIIRQGRFALLGGLYTGPAFGHMFFGTGESTPAELAGRTILSARLYLHRDNSSSAGAMPIRLYTSDLTSIPAAGSSSPNGDANTPEIIIGSLARGAGVWFNISTSVAEWVVAGKCLTLYSSSASHALTCYGTASEDYKPVIEITYADIPDPTEAIIPAIGTVTTAEKLFDWSDSTDYIFDSSELSYEFEFSDDNGSTYSDTVTTDPGISQHTLDIKTLLSFEPGQYYHNTGCKIRVRAKTPLWGDPAQNYYSDWVESAAFTVDYRIIPNAPTVSVDNDAPYEGEGVTFTCRRPAQYNTHDSAGSINELTYQIRYGATTLADETEPVTSATKNVPYTVGELTAGTDLAVSIYARCIDTEGQESPLSAVLPMTIKRFRAPIINIAGAERGETTIDVAVDIQDTGYAGTQSNTQINKIQYNIGAGWVDATLDGWTDLSNSFTVTGIDADLAYTLQVRAVNNPPAGTALTGLTGEATSESIPEFRAAMIVFKDTVKDEKAVGVVKLYLGIEFDEELTDTDVKAFKSLTKEGWIPVADTWEYASVSGIIGIVTVPSGAQSIYRKGDAIKFTQGDPATVKKFYIISDPTDTTIQISGGTDYTLTNEAISDIYYSHIKPVDFPDAFSYTPSFSASSTMTYTVENIYFAMFCMMGGLVKVHIYADGTTGGTMSSTLLASLPIPVHDSCIYTAAAGRTSSGGVTLAGNAWVETDNNAYLRKYDSSNYTAGAGRIFIIHAEYLAA
jgi:hypothetical protein